MGLHSSPGASPFPSTGQPVFQGAFWVNSCGTERESNPFRQPVPLVLCERANLVLTVQHLCYLPWVLTVKINQFWVITPWCQAELGSWWFLPISLAPKQIGPNLCFCVTLSILKPAFTYTSQSCYNNKALCLFSSSVYSFSWLKGYFVVGFIPWPAFVLRSWHRVLEQSWSCHLNLGSWEVWHEDWGSLRKMCILPSLQLELLTNGALSSGPHSPGPVAFSLLCTPLAFGMASGPPFQNGLFVAWKESKYWNSYQILWNINWWHRQYG